MIKGVIFDLDLTLVDTTTLENARKTRNWHEAYRLIPHTSMYAGIQEVLDQIKAQGIKMAIVSSSPRPYVERIVDYYQIPASFIVGYHDAHPVKPHPAPMLKALELMNEKAEDILSFGDRAIDMIASKRAGIKAIACLWGTKERSMLLGTAYDKAIGSPLKILPYIQ
jgi:HAD superfamily hydrolase (TIGR01549 family)